MERLIKAFFCAVFIIALFSQILTWMGYITNGSEEEKPEPTPSVQQKPEWVPKKEIKFANVFLRTTS